MKSIFVTLFIVLFTFASTCFSGVLQPKTGNADNMPETIVLSNGYYQCRYNISKREIDDESKNGTKTVYDYSYIELKTVKGRNYGSVICE